MYYMAILSFNLIYLLFFFYFEFPFVSSFVWQFVCLLGWLIGYLFISLFVCWFLCHFHCTTALAGGVFSCHMLILAIRFHAASVHSNGLTVCGY